MYDNATPLKHNLVGDGERMGLELDTVLFDVDEVNEM